MLLRNLAIRHVVDGPAVDANGAGVRIENVHVNPSQTFRVGRGFRIANATGAVIADSRVNAVVGYGILLSNVGSGTITRVQVSGVDSVAGANGEGIRIVRGSGNTIELSAVRATIGPRILLDSTSGARVTADTLAGRHRLLRVRAATGATVIANTVFDLAQQATDPPSGGSAVDGRAALEILGSGGVSVTGSSFTESGSNAMDAISLIDARGVTLGSSQFRGGRHHVRSTRSTWSLTSSLLENATRSIVAEEADSVTMTSDTLRNGLGRGCVDMRGASSLSVVNGWLASCTSATADTGMAAITVEGTGATLTVRGTRFTGANETAVAFTGGTLTVQNVTLVRRRDAHRSGDTVAGGDYRHRRAPPRSPGSSIVSYGAVDGASLRAGSVRFENNRVWRNRRGLEVSAVVDGERREQRFRRPCGRGARERRASAGSPRSLTGGATRAGRAARRRSTPWAIASSARRTTSIRWPRRRTSPERLGSEDSLRIVRGNNQSAPRNTTLPLRLTVRVMDQQGRPVAGVSVRFRFLTGNGSLDGSGGVGRSRVRRQRALPKCE